MKNTDISDIGNMLEVTVTEADIINETLPVLVDFLHAMEEGDTVRIIGPKGEVRTITVYPGGCDGWVLI